MAPWALFCRKVAAGIGFAPAGECREIAAGNDFTLQLPEVQGEAPLLETCGKHRPV